MYIYHTGGRRVEYTNTSEQTEGLHILHAGGEATAPGHTFGPSVREYYLIHFIVRGKGVFYAENNRYALGGGECFLISPMQVTTYRADTEDPWQYYWIAFSGGEAKRLMRGVFALAPVARIDTFELVHLIRAFSEKTDDFTALDLLFRQSLYALLLSAYRPKEGSFGRSEAVESACRFIAANYDRPFDIAELAERLGYTRAYFTTLFTKAMGSAPHEYLTAYRLSRAKKLLRENPELNITEIALSVGFSGVERFSAVFKERFTLSPSQFRAKFVRSETV
jgi:AraC-like DNA-binding protein